AHRRAGPDRVGGVERGRRLPGRPGAARRHRRAHRRRRHRQIARAGGVLGRRGDGDHGWRRGEFLPRPYWTHNFWLLQYGTFGLYDPPPRGVWVREGHDALLINRYTGEIIAIRRGVFP
ncbi:MAG: RcnB family protein, partial [Caulobacterales bacterium]